MSNSLKFTQRLFTGLMAVAIVEVAAPIFPQHQTYSFVASAHADDDDDDDGGGSSRSSSGGSRAGSGAVRRGGRDLLDMLFGRQPSTPRRARAVAMPDRSPRQIVALGLGDQNIAQLSQAGFVIDARVTIALSNTELVKLQIPRGMTLDAARADVLARAPDATVDFNHYYEPEQREDADRCGGSDCTMVRHVIGWPNPATLTCPAHLQIGLIDTAINPDHPSLEGASLETIRMGETRPEALQSGKQHGTAIAALLVGQSDSRTPGLLPNAKLVAIDAFRRAGKSADRAEVYDLVRALDLLVARNVGIINLSLSGPSNILLERTVQAAVSRGVILVAAAGNNGPAAKPVYPAGYEQVIAVTAVDRSKNPYRRAVRGEHIDIAAPGVGVWTAASITGARQKSGTSFAAPFVAAAAAILKSTRPDLTPQQIADELTKTAEDLGKPGKDPVYGWGLLNARTLCVASNAIP